MKPIHICLSLVTATYLVTSVPACRSFATSATTTSAATDSLEGIIAIVGTNFEHRVVLRTPAREFGLSASREDSASLARLAGLTVRVRGHASTRDIMSVTGFTALRAGDAAVEDGILVESSGRLMLQTNSATRVIGNPPSRLWELKSARVWIGGPLDIGPNIFGIITPPKPSS
jgi:hypothetical protein